MKNQVRYILFTISILIFVIANSCKKTKNSTSNLIKFPFNFTQYGLIPINSGIKEIHDTLGSYNINFYFNSDGKLYSVIEKYHYLFELPSTFNETILVDTTFIYNNILYNLDNKLVKIGNNLKNDIYSFEYLGNNLSKVTQKFIPHFVGDTASLNKIYTFEFTSNNDDNFISAIYNYSSCPFTRTYHYNQNKLDSIVSNISTITCPGQFLIIPSIQFFYENDKIIRTKALTNLGNYNTDNLLIYTNNKLTEIKQPYANAQGAPHTTFIYY